MLRHADPILKLCLAAGALLGGAGVGYYYGIYLPSQDLRRQRLEMAAKQEQAAAQSRALVERAQREQQAQGEYTACVNLAEDAYRRRWTQACTAMHDADQAAYDDCADNLFSTQSGCMAKHPIRPAQDCALPTQAAQSLSQARDQRKNQCAAALASAQQGGQLRP